MTDDQEWQQRFAQERRPQAKAPAAWLRVVFPDARPRRPTRSVGRVLMAWGLLLALAGTASWKGRSNVDRLWGAGLLERAQVLALWMENTPSLWRQK